MQIRFARQSIFRLIAMAGVVGAMLGSRTAGAEKTDLRQLVLDSQRIVFLGDSITASGQYVADFETWLLTQDLAHVPHVINAGLASETVSGLSEEGHAGGKFPRPDLHERLARVLKITKPDLVFACYGINCGIYQPLDDERFTKYQQGYQKLKDEVEAAGARLVAVTPPFYDDQRRKLPFSYNEVLDRYSQWLIANRDAGWLVVDLHGPMTEEMQRQREKSPGFHFQGDGVHPNAAGHWFMAGRLIAAMGGNKDVAAASAAEMLKQHQLPPAIVPLVQKRMTLLRNAYVGAAGHKRPGVGAGLPVAEAEKKGAEITEQINQQIAGKP